MEPTEPGCTKMDLVSLSPWVMYGIHEWMYCTVEFIQCLPRRRETGGELVQCASSSLMHTNWRPAARAKTPSEQRTANNNTDRRQRGNKRKENSEHKDKNEETVCLTKEEKTREERQKKRDRDLNFSYTVIRWSREHTHSLTHHKSTWIERTRETKRTALSDPRSFLTDFARTEQTNKH